MADRFWVGGTNTWNSTAGSKWSATSGGAGGASAPTSADRALFDANSGSGTVTTASTGACGSCSFAGFTGTFAGTQSGPLSLLTGSLTLGSGMTMTWTGATTFTGTSGTMVLTSNGISLNNITLNTPGGTVQLGDTLPLGANATPIITHTAGTFDTNGKNWNAARFNSSNANTRVVTFTSGTCTLSGTGSVWDTSTSTGLTLNKGGTINCTGSGVNITVTCNSVPIGPLKFSAQTAGFNTATTAVVCDGLDFTGSAGTWTNAAITVHGSITYGSGMTLTAGTGAFTWGVTSGTATLTSNGIVFDRPVTIDGVGGTHSLGDAANFNARTLTLTNGTFDDNGKNLSASIFSSSNSNTRSILFNGGTWSLSGTGLAFDCTTGTNLSTTINTTTVSTIKFTDSSATAKSINSGSSTIRMPNIWKSAGTDNFAWNPNGFQCQGLDFTGFSGVANTANDLVMNGGLTLSSGVTIAGNFTVNFKNADADSATRTITSNGNTVFAGVTIISVNPGTLQLADSFSWPSSITIRDGTFSLNNQNSTIASLTYADLGTGACTINMGSGTCTLSTSGTPWDFSAAGANLTFNANTSTLKLTDSSVNTKTVKLGGLTYNNLWDATASTGQVIFTGGGTVADIRRDASAALTHTIKFEHGKTLTFSTWSINGSAGKLVTITSDTAATHTLSKSGTGIVSADYLSIDHSIAAQSNTFYAGDNSTNGGSNTAWIFYSPYISFDAAANSGDKLASANYTFSRTVSKNNAYLSVNVELLTTGSQTVTSVTDDDGAGNVALTFLGAKSTVTGAGRVECWGLAAPASGTKTIRVILSGAIESVATAQIHGGVHQTSSTEAFNSAQATNVGAADASVVITSTTDNTWPIAACVTDDTAITANQTSRNNVSGTLGSGADEDFNGPVTPAGATTMSYTGVGAAKTWAIAGYALRPVSALVSSVSALASSMSSGFGKSSAAGAISGTLASRADAFGKNSLIGVVPGLARSIGATEGKMSGALVASDAALSRAVGTGRNSAAGALAAAAQAAGAAKGAPAMTGAFSGLALSPARSAGRDQPSFTASGTGRSISESSGTSVMGGIASGAGLSRTDSSGTAAMAGAVIMAAFSRAAAAGRNTLGGVLVALAQSLSASFGKISPSGSASSAARSQAAAEGRNAANFAASGIAVSKAISAGKSEAAGALAAFAQSIATTSGVLYTGATVLAFRILSAARAFGRIAPSGAASASARSLAEATAKATPAGIASANAQSAARASGKSSGLPLFFLQALSAARARGAASAALGASALARSSAAAQGRLSSAGQVVVAFAYSKGAAFGRLFFQRPLEAFPPFVALVPPANFTAAQVARYTGLVDPAHYTAIVIGNHMPAARDFPPLDAGIQVQTIAFDFGFMPLPLGVILTGTPVVTISVVSGVDPNPASRLVGQPVIGTQEVALGGSGLADLAVKQQIGPVPGDVIYLLKCSCPATNNDTPSTYNRISGVTPL